ncbi:MAG: RNA 2',3'-cyclic phosphodiesterase [Desulfobacteraceae bacterium]|nr:RNA 2',3'-cyclic phosphodiesterase [Desulfobacteraceae bacterium]
MEHYQEKQKNEKIRAFIAITLPEKVIFHLKDLQTHLKTYKIKASWPKASSMHLTLKFLGDISVLKIQDINHSMHEAVLEFRRENKKLLLSSGGIGVFPSVNKPRIIWSGIKDQTSRLELMHSLLDAHLEKAGFKKEKKHFSPHITICRLKQPISKKHITRILENYSDIKPDTFLVNSITLFKSQLLSSGAVHTKLFSKKI